MEVDFLKNLFTQLGATGLLLMGGAWVIRNQNARQSELENRMLEQSAAQTQALDRNTAAIATFTEVLRRLERGSAS